MADESNAAAPQPPKERGPALSLLPTSTAFDQLLFLAPSSMTLDTRVAIRCRRRFPFLRFTKQAQPHLHDICSIQSALNQFYINKVRRAGFVHMGVSGFLSLCLLMRWHMVQHPRIGVQVSFCLRAKEGGQYQHLSEESTRLTRAAPGRPADGGGVRPTKLAPQAARSSWCSSTWRSGRWR